ncbi:MAG: hypothetical protein CMJ28_04035 [Phycisphaerae bacterium]|nr:hypothetical protein [Phycisphaerae bacterium]
MIEPSVLHEDRQWLVLNKPAGWHCVETKHTDGRPVVETWIRDNLEACKELPEAGLCHRLDLGTTGCLVVAKWRPIRERLRRAMSGDPAARPTKKSYLALVHPGLPPVGRFELYFHGHEAKVRTSEQGNDEQKGICRWKLIRAAQTAASGAEEFDTVEIELLGPGRRHQIRAGLAHFGYPLVDDQNYGGTPWPAGTGFAALHAHCITLDGTSVTAAPPDSWSIQDPCSD